MKFTIVRTSDYMGQPCAGAVMNAEREWEIEIETLDELITFARANGKIILRVSASAAIAPDIEIYDDYRE